MWWIVHMNVHMKGQWIVETNWNMLTVFPACPKPSSVWTRPIGTFLEHRTEEASCPLLASPTVEEQPFDSKTAWRIFSLYTKKSHKQVKGSVIYFSSLLVTEK